MIGLPIDNGAQVQFWQSFLRLVLARPISLQAEFNVGDSLVPRARNELTARFLASDCTHLLFIDSDLIFQPGDVEALLARNLDIVGGFYPKKQAELEYVCNALSENVVECDGLRQVRYLGTGFLMIARKVFEVMQDRRGDALAYRSDFSGRIEHDFWSVGTYQYPDGSRRYLSEDWFFCQRAMDLGFKVWGDTRVVLKHVGQAVYPLQPTTQTFSTPTAGNGTPGADAIRPSSAPALSTDCVRATAPAGAI
jgi:hypothetical protein